MIHDTIFTTSIGHELNCSVTNNTPNRVAITVSLPELKFVTTLAPVILAHHQHYVPGCSVSTFASINPLIFVKFSTVEPISPNDR